MKRLAGLGALLAALVGCSTFPVIEADECGNGVKEKGEDCDTATEMVPGGICLPKGVVGECHWDCRPNADDKRGKCPDGYGCASDGICRKATGELDAPVLISGDLSSWVSEADFDGDERPELLSMELVDQVQQGRLRLHYFDDDSQLVETRTFPRLTTRPIVRKLDTNVGDDLVFSNFRVGMLPGRQDRELVPAAFSSYVVDDSELFGVTVSDYEIGDAIGLAAFTALRGAEGIYVPSSDSGRLQIRRKLSRPLSQLVAAPTAADLFNGTSSPCSEVLYGFKGDGVVHVLDMCELGSDPLGAEFKWRDAPLEQLVTLPAGVQLDAQPVAADMDGDGHLDLLISANHQTFVAYGDGARLQSRAEPLSIWLQRESVEEPREPSFVPTVLAAGDITGDGVADLVLPDVVLGSRRSLLDSRIVYFGAFGNNAVPWTTAEVVDLNGNQRLDVIAATKGERGLSFLNGTGGPFPVGARIATRGAVRLLATGNFDGDSSRDITFVEAGSPDRDSDSLWVAYGQQDGLPREPARIADSSGVQQLGSQREQGVDDIFTSSKARVRGTTRSTFTLFGGDASRMPLAPYTLVEFKKDDSLEDYIAPALLLGAFTRPDQHDVIALGTQNVFQGWNQWLLPGFGSLLEPPRLLGGEAVPGTAPATGGVGGVRVSVAGAAADVDGDGLDEAIWLMPEGVQGCALLVFDVEPGSDLAQDPGRTNLRSKLSLAEPCVAPELSAADVDDDGRADLLLLLGDPDSAVRGLQILWNDGDFSLDDRTLLEASEPGSLRGFSLFPSQRPARSPPSTPETLDPGEPKGPRIALVTESALFFATRRQRHFDVARGPGDFHDARSVVVTDPNRDGFKDVVVADADGLWLLEAELR